MKLRPHIRAAIENYLPHMEGWTTVERGCEMAAAIIELQAKVIVDIGVFAARSTLAMGFAARELGESMVYGIDPWSPEAAAEGDDVPESSDWWKEKSRLEDMHQQAMKAVWDHRIEQWVTMIRARSEHIHKLFHEIDVLNIDGAHGEKASCNDVTLYVPKVVKGGFVFMDDCDWPTTAKAIGLLEQQCDLTNDTGKARTYRKR